MSQPEITDVVPHRGMMVLLDRLIDESAEHVRAEYTPKTNAWYADADGNMPGWFGIELMAQVIAAHAGLDARRKGGKPKIGFLLGTRRYKAGSRNFRAGVPLTITARLSFREENGLGAYECSIQDGKQELASATIKAFEPPDITGFMKDNPHG